MCVDVVCLNFTSFQWRGEHESEGVSFSAIQPRRVERPLRLKTPLNQDAAREIK
jgi:hypothetical protein